VTDLKPASPRIFPRSMGSRASGPEILPKPRPPNIALRGAILDRLKGGVCGWGQTSPSVIILPHVEMERLVRNDGQALWAP